LWLSEKAEALAGPDDWEVQTWWRATRAKLLARRGQFPAAAHLAEEAVALVPASYDGPVRAESLVAQAEVSRLAGALDQAEASLRQALQFYEDRRMVPFAEQARALLATLAAQRRTRAEQGTAAKAGGPPAGRSSPAAEARAAPAGRSKRRPSRPRKAAVVGQAEATTAPAREPRPDGAPRPGVPRS
jgi:tetratricopeptide (TPR) repeat protein